MAYDVGPGLAELAAQRDLGRLHRHRQPERPAQVVEVEVAGEVGVGHARAAAAGSSRP